MIVLVLNWILALSVCEADYLWAIIQSVDLSCFRMFLQSNKL